MFIEPEKLSIQRNCRKRKYGNKKIYKKNLTKNQIDKQK